MFMQPGSFITSKYEWVHNINARAFLTSKENRNFSFNFKINYVHF